MWEYLYKVVSFCNQLFEWIDMYQQIYNDEELFVYWVEVCVFCVLYYYYLMDLFVCVFLVFLLFIFLKGVKQNSCKEVFDFVVKELQEFEFLLEMVYSNCFGNYYGCIICFVVCFLFVKFVLNVEIYMDNNWIDG